MMSTDYCTLDFRSLCKTLLSWICSAAAHISANHLKIWKQKMAIKQNTKYIKWDTQFWEQLQEGRGLRHRHRTAQLSVAESSGAGLLHCSTPSQYTGSHQLNKQKRTVYPAVQTTITVCLAGREIDLWIPSNASLKATMLGCFILDSRMASLLEFSNSEWRYKNANTWRIYSLFCKTISLQVW